MKLLLIFILGTALKVNADVLADNTARSNFNKMVSPIVTDFEVGDDVWRKWISQYSKEIDKLGAEDSGPALTRLIRLQHREDASQSCFKQTQWIGFEYVGFAGFKPNAYRISESFYCYKVK